MIANLVIKINYFTCIFNFKRRSPPPAFSIFLVKSTKFITFY